MAYSSLRLIALLLPEPMKKIALTDLTISGLLAAHRIMVQYPNCQITLFSERKKNHDDKYDMGGCILYPKGDFFQGVSPAIREELTKYKVNIDWFNIPLGQNYYYVLKDSLISKYPKNSGKIYTSPLLFITEKIRYYFALRKKYSLWPDITLYQAARTIFGDNFAEYVASPAVRKLYFSEIEDIELGSVFPELSEYMSCGGNLKGVVDRVQVPDVSLLFPREGSRYLAARLIDLLPAEHVRLVDEPITRYKGNGVLQCGSKEYGPFDKIIFPESVEFLAKIFRKDFSDIAELAAEIKTNYLNSVYLAYDRRKVSPKGRGVLIPRKEKLPLSFVDYLTNIDSSRSTPDVFLIRGVIAGDNDILQEEDLVSFAVDAMRKILRIKERPIFSRVFRKVFKAPMVSKGTYRLRQAIKAAEQTDGHFVVLPGDDALMRQTIPPLSF